MSVIRTSSVISYSVINLIKDGVKNWSVEEKEFFNKKVHKGNSPERRSFGEASAGVSWSVDLAWKSAFGCNLFNQPMCDIHHQ